jgi:hypothetical protein
MVNFVVIAGTAMHDACSVGISLTGLRCVAEGNGKARAVSIVFVEVIGPVCHWIDASVSVDADE